MSQPTNEPIIAPEPCVRLFTSQRHVREDPSRLLISHGTLPVELMRANAVAYLPGARLPAPPWRPLTDDEHAAIWANQCPPLERTVGIVQVLDPDSLEEIRGQLPGLMRMQSVDPRTSSEPVAGLLLKCIERVCTVEGPLVCHGVAEHPPGRATVTFDSSHNAFLGLHLDAWEGLDIEQLPSARNRICINIGLQDRFFLFANLTVADMARRLAARGGLTLPPTARAIADTFLARSPASPVHRLRVHPGEAYIAPTENIVHDGSSSGTTAVSRHVTVRGYFGFHSK